MKLGHTPPPGHQSGGRPLTGSFAYVPKPRILRDLWQTPIGYVQVERRGNALQVVRNTPDEETAS